MNRSTTLVLFCSFAIASLPTACGGDPESTSHTARGDVDHTSGSEREPEPDDGIQIEGLMGTLSQTEIQMALEPRMERFARCFAQRYDELDFVGGDVVFAFRVGTNGRVRWVYPSSSTVGDRQTERCLLDVANGARFPEPHGGEAEFSWAMGIDPPEDVRPPQNWDGSYVAEAVSQNRQSVRSCGAGSATVTAYIAPGGSVIAAGAAVSDLDGADGLDCIAEAVAGWTLPDPGSYAAKVTFQVP